MSRPRFQPSPEHPKLVRRLAACGIKQEDIALIVGVRSPKTLRKHFREELDRAAIEANANVAQSLYKSAVSGKDTTAAIFWLKCRGGWRDNKDAHTRSAAPPFIVERSEEPK
jgi:hypothetical protein